MFGVAKALGSSRLIAEYDFEYGISIIKVPVLNKVDDHHLVVCYRLLIEFEEAKKATMELIDIIENKTDERLTDDDWKNIYDNEIQIIDTLACVQMHLITMEEKFRTFSKDRLEQMQNRRLKDKGYY